MPRKKLIRRFEPRYGVSEEILAFEARYVAQEVEDYRTYAIKDLKDMLAERQSQWLRADGSLQVQCEVLPERERLIVQCLLVRDIYHLLELYARTFAVPSPEFPDPFRPSQSHGLRRRRSRSGRSRSASGFSRRLNTDQRHRPPHLPVRLFLSVDREMGRRKKSARRFAWRVRYSSAAVFAASVRPERRMVSAVLKILWADFSAICCCRSQCWM